MSDPYIGEIRMFGGNFAPAGWMFCQGQVLPISEYDTLFNLIGTTYGGDGQETFALPNLASRVPIHAGQGPGITQNYVQGETVGVETVTINAQQLPVHNHTLLASTDPANQISPQGGVLAVPPSLSPYFAAPPDAALSTGSVSGVGGAQPHDNTQPFLAISFIISLFGIYPSQS